MVKLPSYGKLAIQKPAAKEPEKPEKPAAKAVTAEAGEPAAKRRTGRPAAGRTMKEAASPMMLYLHPRGHKALKRYALDQNTKAHTLVIQALEEWALKKGLRDPMRIESEGKRKDDD